MDNRISDLLLKVVTGIATPDEVSEANRLIESDPTVKREWEALYHSYNQPEVQQELASIDLDHAYERIVGPGRRSRRLWIAAAAAILLIGGLTYLYFPRSEKVDPTRVMIRLASGKLVPLPDSGATAVGTAVINASRDSATFTDDAAGSGAQNTLTVPRGRTFAITLGDGSSVRLNAATTLKFPFTFTGATREIYVNGEAYLRVAPDADHPFLVHTDHGTIKVLGTSFNVNTYTEMVVSLQNGAVSVTNQRDTLYLDPGYEIVVSDSTGKMTVRRFDPETRLSWLTGVIHWENITVKELAGEIERHYNVSVFIDNKSIENRSFAGDFQTSKSLEFLLTTLNNTGSVVQWSLDEQGNVHIR